nr:hypothetical protein [Tanacetum cinerariifolium]
MRHGFDLGYKTWVHHGELALPPRSPIINNTRQPQMSDMTVLLNDLSYITPNNEHNEPTQGDIGETSNEPTQATCNEFEELYASANKDLYPEFFQNVFLISKGYKLPPSYYAIKKKFKMIGLGYESIHACEHDCYLFWGKENKDLDLCLVCNTSRRKDNNTSGKKVPKKVLRYFPIIPRLQLLYKSSHTAKEMIWHATGKCTELDKIKHPVDGRAWKKFATMYLDFAKEPRNQICSATLMEDDMMKAQIKVVDILCDLELIYPPALFDIMIHLVIHLPLEALEGGPIHPWWMFPFEKYMKKLKGYVWNKAKPKDGQSTKVDAPPDIIDVPDKEDDIIDDEDALPHDLAYYDDEDLINIDDDEDDIIDDEDAFPHDLADYDDEGLINIDDDEVSTTSELFALACGPTWTPISVNSCVVDGVSLNDLDNATLHIDGQSTKVDAPPDIIDVPDKVDDIIDDEDALPHDLADYDNKDLINIDDDGVDKMSVDVARSYGSDGGGKDRPPPHHVPIGCGGCFANRGKGKRKPNLGGRAAGRLHTRDKTQNLSQSSATQEYPSLIDTFFVAHIVNGVFTRDEDRLIYFKSAGASGCGDDEESVDDQEDEDADSDGDS